MILKKRNTQNKSKDLGANGKRDWKGKETVQRHK